MAGKGQDGAGRAAVGGQPAAVQVAFVAVVPVFAPDDQVAAGLGRIGCGGAVLVNLLRVAVDEELAAYRGALLVQPPAVQVIAEGAAAGFSGIDNQVLARGLPAN